jgi:transposase InsO family protein
VAHANAALTPRMRLRLARAVVEDGWTVSYAAAVFQVAYPTAKRWADRYRQAGPAGMVDRSSRPHRCPRRTPRPVVRKIVHLRWRHRLGPVEIAARLGMPASTVYGVLRRAVAWFAARGVTVERVLSDNGSAYRSHTWRDACLELGIKPKRTRPYRPQTNGKIERFHRTMADGWAFRRMFLSELARHQALPGWLHEYNHHRPHTAIGCRPPITRLTNLAGQYT